LLGCLVWSLLLTGVGWTWFYHRSPAQQISVNRFWHLKKSDHQVFTFCRSLTGLYALQDAPYRFAYDLAEHPMVPLLPVKLDEKVLNSLSLERSRAGQQLTLNLEKWSYRFMVMDLIVAWPMTGKAVLEGRDLVLEFNNPGPYTLRNSCFYFRDRLFRLEDLGPGQTLQKRFSEKELGEQELFSEIQAERTAKEMAGRALSPYAQSVEKIVTFEALTRIAQAAVKRNPGLHFCGWLEQDFLPLAFEKPVIQGAGITFLEWTLAVQGAAE
jgi:hypothetical protein